MKICIVTTNFPRWPGDMRVPFLFEETQALERLGLHIRVIATHNPGAKTHEWMDGLEVFRPRYLPDRFEILQKDMAGLPLAWKKNPWSRVVIIPYLIIQTLAVAFLTRGFDMIHANWTLSAVLTRYTQWIHRTPYIVTVHGSDIFQAAKKPLVKYATVQALKHAKVVLAVSSVLQEETIKMGVPAEKVKVMSNGVNLSRFLPPEITTRGPILLYVGTLIPRKGLFYLLKAMPEVLSKHSEARLYLIGEGEQKQQLLDLVTSLNLNESVTFLGTMNQEQVAAWMGKSRVFILPSTEEGQGVVLLEALASGTPCIGSAVGGIPDVVTPEVGRLVPPGNSEALATAIHELLQDDELWLKLSRQARQRAEQEYDWDVIAARIMEIYQS